MKIDDSKPMSLRDLLYFILASFCQLAAIAAIFIGIFLPPEGLIDGSILTYFGITCGFAGSLLGITSYVRNP